MCSMPSVTRKTLLGSSRLVFLHHTSSPERSLPLKSGVVSVGATGTGSAAMASDSNKGSMIEVPRVKRVPLIYALADAAGLLTNPQRQEGHICLPLLTRRGYSQTRNVR